MEYTIVTNNQKVKHETTTHAIFFIVGGIILPVEEDQLIFLQC